MVSNVSEVSSRDFVGTMPDAPDCLLMCRERVNLFIVICMDDLHIISSTDEIRARFVVQLL